MAKKVYVNGSILIKTSDFKYEGAGAESGGQVTLFAHIEQS